VGLDYLGTVTELLQRVRAEHPTAGLYEAADFQWWWAQTPRPTDAVPQLFWFGGDDQPVAAVIATRAGDQTQLDPIVMPDATPEWVAHVMTRGLTHAAEQGIDSVTLEVDRADDAFGHVLANHGLTAGEEAMVENWLAAGDRPPISPLADGYRLASRAETSDRPHHMINAGRNHPDVEPRLRQTSLYRPDLDLVVHDADGNVAAYGLFWYDPTTATGLVEPMRTEDAHQQRGLARHVLTAGLDRLTRAGARRIKICYEPDNPASGRLYRSVGFRADRHTVIYSGPTTAHTP